MSYIIGIPSLLIGIAIGLNLPDKDLETSYLVHRSILTHGCLLPALFFWLARKRGHAVRLFAIGVSLSSAVHLCFDLFPRAWIGFALIHIPLYGRTTAAFSWLWIASSIAVCLYLAFALVKNAFEIVIVMSSLIIVFGHDAAMEKSAFWPALITMMIATTLGLTLPGDKIARKKEPQGEK